MKKAELAAVTQTAPEPAPRRTKVAVLGFTQSFNLAPFQDPEWEIWGLNELYMFIPRWDRWFELHKRSVYEADKKRTSEHVAKLQGMTCPVYMHQHWDDIGPSVPLPKEFIEAAAGSYMTSSIAWMIGLAIAEGFEEIQVYGVDIAQDTEWSGQRPCCEYLLGLAQGRGIKTYLPATSDILKSVGQYGFGSGGAFGAKIEERMAWLEREHKAWQAKGAQLDGEFHTKRDALQHEYEGHRENIMTNLRQLEGARDDCGYWQRSWAVRADAKPGVAPNPDRTADPRTGITVQPNAIQTGPVPLPIPSGDSPGG